MTKLLEIKGIKWNDPVNPTLVWMQCVMIDTKLSDLAIDQEGRPEWCLYDLSKLANIRHHYPEGSDNPDEKQTWVEFVGVDSHYVLVPFKNMVTAWQYYKNWQITY